MPGTTDIGNHGDDTVITIALPFSYTLYDQTFTIINLSSNGNAQFATSDATFGNLCLPWTAHNYTIYPYWDDLYLVNSPVGHIHIDKRHCSQPHLQHRVACAVFPGKWHCQLRAEVVRGTDSLRRDLRHID